MEEEDELERKRLDKLAALREHGGFVKDMILIHSNLPLFSLTSYNNKHVIYHLSK